jgi:hypothetical protein
MYPKQAQKKMSILVNSVTLSDKNTHLYLLLMFVSRAFQLNLSKMILRGLAECQIE